MGCRKHRIGGSASSKLMNSDKRPSTRRVRGLEEPRHEYHSRHHRPRRKWRSHAVRILFLSCLIVAASTEGDETKDETTEDCAARRVVKFNFKNIKVPLAPLSQLLPTFPPHDTPQLGDGIRSEEASGCFFDSIDSDGDGAIEPEEVAMFLQNEIGGKQFDTQSEVDDEVGTIMEILDQNKNNGLEMSDMLDYWMKLECLLTAEEVSEWIVYSVQLPSTVGKIFLENGITGYDFLEIVDNGGAVLQNELGIDKVSFRNKIVRQMQTRMLGIGSSPGTPKDLTFRLESCKAITLKWDRSTARVFPVHSYRIQRRAINLFGNDSLNGVAATNSNNFESHVVSNSDWRTVYVGSDNEFVDSGLETGHNYMYRVQAWNSVGKSGWETTDLTHDLKKQRCSTKPSQPAVATERGIPSHAEAGAPWEWTSTTKNALRGIVTVVQFAYHSVRFFLAFIAVLGGVLKFRRATATSSASAHTILPFPWVWKAINHLWKKGFGQELIPRTLLGDREAMMLQEQMHDEQIAAKGLRGYERIRKKAALEEGGNDGVNPQQNDRRANFKKEKSYSTGDLLSATPSFAPPKEVVIPREGGTPNKFAWMRKRRSLGQISDQSETSSIAHTLRSRVSNMSNSDHARSINTRRRMRFPNDGNVCSECNKRFKVGKRYKHHCSRCMATFCHKHGRTTHSNFTSCRVPGDCMCNSCLAVLQSREHHSEHNYRS